MTNAYEIINWWNHKVKPLRDRQNAEVIYMAQSMRVSCYTQQGLRMEPCPPGLIYAEYSPHAGIRDLHACIHAFRKQIHQEVTALVQRGYMGVPMVEMDTAQRSLGDPRWRPIWVKFLHTWAGTAQYLPTLRHILQLLGRDVLLLHVSVFGPGTQLPEHRGISMGVVRYHYALDIPEGDTGMVIGGKRFKWAKHRGYAFDDTYPHAAWNHTNSPRWVIFADLPRELDFPYNIINSAMHHIIEYTSHVKAIAARLEKEGLSSK